MSRAWQAVGGALALAGLGVAVWGLWWVPPAGKAPPPVGVAAMPPPTPVPDDPLADLLAARQPVLEACLGAWREATPDAPAEVRLRVVVEEPAQAEAGTEGGLLRVTVVGDAPGRLVLEACAEAALAGGGGLSVPPGQAEVRLGAPPP